MKRALLLCILALACPAWASAPLVKGRFSLLDARDGRAVTQDSYKGKLKMIFFGFTRCQATCPRGLDRMSRALGLLGPQADQVAALFISIDPKRDTAAQLKVYAGNFGPRIVPLTGKPKAVAAAMKSFRLEAQKVGQPGEQDYQLEHPAIYYLMDRQGRYLQTLSVWEEPKALAESLRKALTQD